MTASTGVFTTRIADPSADRGKGIVLLNGTVGFVKPASRDQTDVTLGPLAGGAGIAAGCHPALVDSVAVRRRLGVELKGGTALAEAFVEGIADRHWADFGTFAAAVAALEVYVARFGA